MGPTSNSQFVTKRRTTTHRNSGNETIHKTGTRWNRRTQEGQIQRNQYPFSQRLVDSFHPSRVSVRGERERAKAELNWEGNSDVASASTWQKKWNYAVGWEPTSPVLTLRKKERPVTAMIQFSGSFRSLSLVNNVEVVQIRVSRLISTTQEISWSLTKDSLSNICRLRGTKKRRSKKRGSLCLCCSHCRRSCAMATPQSAWQKAKKAIAVAVD